MRRLLIVLAAASCVPPAPANPRGAIGVVVEPSAATRGEAFVTEDGWTVHLERITLFVMITAFDPSGPDGEPGEGLYLWNANARTELVLRAVRAGPQIVSTELQGESDFDVEGARPSFYTNVNVEASLEDRFRHPPDGLDDGHVGVIVAVRGEKGDRTIALDLAIAGRHSPLRQPIDVRADAITFVTLDLFAERFFPTLQEIADADVDGDGHVTGAELRDAELLASLSDQSATILVPR